MFVHALRAKVLIGVPLREYGSWCNLHYADDLLVLTTGGLKDLRAVKLMLYVFEGLIDLETNFAKTCLYFEQDRWISRGSIVETLNCVVGKLPITYLGIPIYGRRPHKQDWEGLIFKIRRCLSAWKVRHLSLRGRFTLVNSMLSVIPTYWIFMFRLPCWVIKQIDRIRRDFLWSSPKIDHPSCPLASWKKLCQSHD